jgi:hypothetical protein
MHIQLIVKKIAVIKKAKKERKTEKKNTTAQSRD